MIEAFQRLPGVGRKTAVRFAFHLIRSPESVSAQLSTAAGSLKKNLVLCSTCRTVTDQPTCAVCQDTTRDTNKLCIVAEPLDMLAIEQAGAWTGRYHVLQGLLNPLEGITEEHLTIADLKTRLTKEPITEIVLALNPSTEGEATALTLRSIVPENISVSRIARGIPTGSDITFADDVTIAESFTARQKV